MQIVDVIIFIYTLNYHGAAVAKRKMRLITSLLSIKRSTIHCYPLNDRQFRRSVIANAIVMYILWLKNSPTYYALALQDNNNSKMNKELVEWWSLEARAERVMLKLVVIIVCKLVARRHFLFIYFQLIKTSH